MQNPSYELTPETVDNAIPYPEMLDRVYYRNGTFSNTTEWNLLPNLSGLRYLYIYQSTFPVGTQWSILNSAGSMPNIVYLYLLSNTNIGGLLPTAWSTISQLQRMYLDRNIGTTPTVPTSWSALTRLRYMFCRSMGWTTADVDQFLSAFAVAATNGLGSNYGTNKRLYLNNSGSTNANGAPTGGASNPDIVTLVSLGWTVYHN